MDYEKKYNDAMARCELIARTGLKFNPGYIFPELSESEDERMRKLIIDRVRSATEMTESLRDLLLTYLEKQKEQPISAEEVLARAGLKPYKDGNKWCILAGDNIQEGICGFGDTIEDALYEFLMEVLEKQKEQNSAEWSEEDEKRVKQLIYDTEHIRAEYEKRKKELGESFNDELIKDCDEQIAWLKSLRPRPSWKPSEEQMFVLGRFLKSLHESGSPDFGLMDSLIGKLQKL